MPLLKAEPAAPIRTLEELFAVAAAMEREAIDGYRALAERMRHDGRPELVAVFERLAEEESRHLANVDHWSLRETGAVPDASALRWDPDPVFDDEGASSIAPELLSAYRAFSTAVRNEERAFAFWTYVAANSVTDGLRSAAEQMAREELEHVATLRRERRRAFHAERMAAGGEDWTLAALEQRLAALLDAVTPGSASLENLARLARERAASLAAEPLGNSSLLTHVRPEAVARLRPAAELLLEAYLDLAERLPSQIGRDRAQSHATELLDCLSAARAEPGDAGTPRQ